MSVEVAVMAMEQQPPVNVNKNKYNYTKQGSLTTKRCGTPTKGGNRLVCKTQKQQKAILAK